MSLVNRSQLKELLVVGSDGAFPLWRLAGPSSVRLRRFNPALVAFFLGLVYWLVTISPFPVEQVAQFEDGRLVLKDPALNAAKLYTRGIGGMLAGAVVVVSFLVDFKDTVGGTIGARFIYKDPEHSSDLRAWWCIVLLLVGYVARIWVFSITSMISLEAAHLSAIIETGEGIFVGSGSPSSWGNPLDAFLYSIQNPLAVWGVEISGEWFATTVVAFTSIARVVLLTFLLGGFGLVLRNIPNPSSTRN